MQGIKTEWILWGLGIGAALVFLPGLLKTGARNVGESAGAAVDGVLTGAADVVLAHSPLPDTRTDKNKQICLAARAAGDDFKASFYCPAADWLTGLFDGEWF